ncbi:MAG: GGDEF domain-containing protein [Rhodospirillales bacterium]|nr:GGDEF domain-containing protein [Rhodospirillales bacterium]
MDMHSLYFIGYALFATVGGIIIAQAQYSRKRKEGKKINYTILKVVFGFALLMWTGAALSAVYYTESHTALTVSGILVGIILSALFGWQINAVIRKLQMDEKTIEDLATHDAITGLWIRRVFHQTLKTKIERADQLGHPLSILILKIDNLKEINSELGYEAGDLVLQKLPEIILRAVRPTDLVCRYGSRKIAIIFPNLDAKIAGKFARSFQTEIAAHDFNTGGGNTIAVTITAGVVGYTAEMKTERAYLDAVERALHTAEKSGPNSLCVA